MLGYIGSFDELRHKRLLVSCKTKLDLLLHDRKIEIIAGQNFEDASKLRNGRILKMQAWRYGSECLLSLKVVVRSF